ncbi:histone deacetylase [Actinoalloteichus sp. GBA129-24]|uniref:histone deacetylase n=1 Tax=Actinoalloteichus sp. GBA129-24 TaxID=1612551 RepID=UPI000952CC1B|nr:histone deacetylase [Actinoalloteichus sp. GBA129-24]
MTGSPSPPPAVPRPSTSPSPELVWYVSYGSNMCAERLRLYLAGGTPPGTTHAYPGCRDPRPLHRSVGCLLTGGVYFATESSVWGGGRAFYDPELPGPAAACAHLISAGQFADLTAQEMYREPGADLDMRPVLAAGRHELGPGRYETLLHVGDREGSPMLTFTAPWQAAQVDWVAPSAGYLRVLRAGLGEAHGWDAGRAGRYLATLPGAQGRWTAAAISSL